MAAINRLRIDSEVAIYSIHIPVTIVVAIINVRFSTLAGYSSLISKVDISVVKTFTKYRKIF